MSEPVLAGIIYERGAHISDVLRAFVRDLQDEGLNVHGILQETPKELDLPDDACGVDAIDIKSGDRTALVRPTQYELDNKICSLNLSQLAEASQILRRALDDRADVVVVEKFGKHEKDGGGLSADLMAVIAEGIPTVVAVSKTESDSWSTFHGGLADDLDCDIEAVRAWWKTQANA